MADQIVQKLVAQFVADVKNETFTEANTKLKDFEKEYQKSIKDLKLKGLNDLASNVEVELKTTKEKYDRLTKIEKDFYRKKYDDAKEHGAKEDELKKMEEQALSVIHNIKKKEIDDYEKFGKQNLQQVDQGYQKIIATGKQLISTFAPGLVGIMGVTGFVKELEKANERLHEMQFIAARINFSAGEGGSNIGGGFMAKMEQFRKTTNMPLEQLGQLGMSYAREGIGYVKGKSGKMGDLGGMVEQAVGLGTAYQVQPEYVVETEKKFRRFGVNVDDLGTMFNKLAGTAQGAQMPVEEYIGYIIQLTEQNRKYGASITESAKWINHFADQLKDNTITMAQITALQRGVSQEGRGKQSFIGEQLLKSGMLSPERQEEFSKYKNNPIAMGMAIREWAEGPQSAELTKLVGRMAVQMGDKLAESQGLTGHAKDLFQLDTMERYMKLLGLGSGSTIDQLKARRGDFKTDGSLLGVVSTGGVTADQKAKEGIEALKASKTLLTEMKLSIEQGFNDLATSLSITWKRIFSDKSMLDIAMNPKGKANIPYQGLVDLLEKKQSGIELTKQEKKDVERYMSMSGVGEALVASRPGLAAIADVNEFGYNADLLLGIRKEARDIIGANKSRGEAETLLGDKLPISVFVDAKGNIDTEELWDRLQKIELDKLMMGEIKKALEKYKNEKH